MSGVHVSVEMEEADDANVFNHLSSRDAGIYLESDMMRPDLILQKNPTPRDSASGVL